MIYFDTAAVSVVPAAVSTRVAAQAVALAVVVAAVPVHVVGQAVAVAVVLAADGGMT